MRNKLFFREENLKYIALITMIIDHLAVVFIDFNSPLYVIMRTIGRISAPIFCWFLVKGYHRTHNLKRYASRILIFAVLAFYPFIFVFSSSLNMMFLFLFGLVFLQGVHRKGQFPLKVLEIAISVVGACFCDYGIFGLAMIFSLDYIKKNKPIGITVFVVAVFAYYFPNDFEFNRRLLYALASVLALVLVSIPLKKSEKSPSTLQKYFFYAFYPLHLWVFCFFLNVK